MASGSRKRYTASQVRQMMLDSDVDDSDGSDILIEVIIHFCKTLTFAGDDMGCLREYDKFGGCQL